jgi:ABC-type phosphate transport system substrate-binding protein
MVKHFSTLVVGLVLTGVLEAPVSAARGPFKVIVGAKVSGRAVAREVLAQIYLGKVARWGDGVEIEAVDLSGTSPVRRAFSLEILGMSVDGVKHHWLDMVTAGKRPPLTKASDEDVIAFVARQPGGVGYVSNGTLVPASVREVEVY